MPAPFIWYELMTEDTGAALDFYRTVVGWTSEAWNGSDMDYSILKVGDTGVGGVMAIPADAKAMGAGPAWVGYIHVADVDASAASIAGGGGSVHRQPSDIPGVGRFAVVADPHGAHFMLLAPIGPEAPPRPPPRTPGLVGWRELLAGDLDEAWTFYEAQFGWSKQDAIDMGEMGIYQLFGTEGDQGGGMMTKPPQVSQAYWGFYFNVEAIDAAVLRIGNAGGQVIFGPMEVPGGDWVINAVDPQGAFFGLVAPRR